jgi:glycosyltransferase involved in cell wall biosynthesis
VRQLLDAFETLSERDPGRRQLVVAGAASPGPEVDDFLRRCVLHPFISLHEGRIPGEDMQLFLRAADIVVLPYLRSLNSGVLMLALSFGLPVVAPAVGGIAEVVTPDIGRTFTPGDADSLLAAMLAADELRNPEAREAALGRAREYDPGRLSADFSRAVVERIRTPRPMALPVARGK